jgi:4-amino-4-deoxy-L-arabinose transferase-like glycosyltransferase
MKKVFDWKILFLLIFLLAGSLRVWQLEEMPSGFHRDEVISGYVGRFIFENGQDIYGNFLPLLYVDKYGDYPPALPMYLSGISTLLLGPTVFATRLPIAIVGTLLLIPFFFLAKNIFKDTRIALFSVFILAILPWHIMLSRATSEGTVALTIVVWGLLHLVQAIHNQKPKYLIAALLLMGLTYLLYPSYRILVPLMLLPVPFLFTFHKLNKRLLLGGIACLIGLTLFIASTPWGLGRYDQTSVFGEQGRVIIQPRIAILAQEEGSNNVPTVKAYHNKYIMQGREIMEQYVNYFSPQYLFNAGGLPYRYSVSDQGLFYLITIPLLLLAVIFSNTVKKRIGLFLFYLLLISPLPAPLTIDDVPNVHRTLFMIVPLTLLASFGLFRFIDMFKKGWIKHGIMLIVIVVFCIELIYFLHMYYHHANAVKSFDRGDTNKELISYVIDQRKNFDTVYIPVHDVFPFYYLLFTNNFDRSIVDKTKKNLLIWNLDNITFTDTYCPAKDVLKEIPNKKILVIEREECRKDERFIEVKKFVRHDGTTSYRFFVPK